MDDYYQHHHTRQDHPRTSDSNYIALDTDDDPEKQMLSGETSSSSLQLNENADMMRIRQKSRQFQAYCRQGAWKNLVETCYAPNAQLAYGGSTTTATGRDAIFSFFQQNNSQENGEEFNDDESKKKKKPASGYDLNLQYTLVPLLAVAAEKEGNDNDDDNKNNNNNCGNVHSQKQTTIMSYLMAGVGSVNGGIWCPFVERWEYQTNDWFIVQDKVSSPEPWMM